MPTITDWAQKALDEITECENAADRARYAVEQIIASETPTEPQPDEPAPTDPEPDPVDPEPSPPVVGGDLQAFLDSYDTGVHELTHVPTPNSVSYDLPELNGQPRGYFSSWIGMAFRDGVYTAGVGGHDDGYFDGLWRVNIITGDAHVTKASPLTRPKNFTSQSGKEYTVMLPERDDYVTRHIAGAIVDLGDGKIQIGGYSGAGCNSLERAANLPLMWQFDLSQTDADGYNPRKPMAYNYMPTWGNSWSGSGYSATTMELPDGKTFWAFSNFWRILNGETLVSSGGADPGWSCCYHPRRNAVYGIAWGKEVKELKLDDTYTNVISDRFVLEVDDADWTYESGIAPWGDDLIIFNGSACYIVAIETGDVTPLASPFPEDDRRVFNRFREIGHGAYLFVPADMDKHPYLWRPRLADYGGSEPVPAEPTPDPTPEPTGDIPYGDVDALIAQGWLPDYRDTGKAYSRVEMDALRTDFSGSAGERNEIGLVPEEYAAYIATRDPRYLEHTLRLADEIPRESWENKEIMTAAIWRGGEWSIDFAHTPAYWYCAHLETGDPWYIFPAEQIYRWFMQWLWNKPEDEPGLYTRHMKFGFNARVWAWMMRNLCRLARLQSLGLTKYTYYKDAMQANLQNVMDNRVNSTDAITQDFRVIGWNKGALPNHYLTGWQESMIGQTLGHMLQMGFTEWEPVAEWHLEQLRRKIEYWGMKGVDHDHYVVEHELPYTFEGSLPYYSEDITQDFLDWPKQKALDTNIRRTNGDRYTYQNRLQYAYGWAAIQSQAGGVPGARELAEQIDAAITERGDVRDYKNAPVI